MTAQPGAIIEGRTIAEWRSLFLAADFSAATPSMVPTDLCGVIPPLRHELKGDRPTPCYVLRTYGSNYGQNPAALRVLVSDSDIPLVILRRQIAIFLTKRLTGARFDTLALTFECDQATARFGFGRISWLRVADRTIRGRLNEHERAISAIVAAEVAARTPAPKEVVTRAIPTFETQAI